MRVDSAEPIAVVGISCRLPGAPGPRQFWRLLLEGGDALGEAPADRFPAELPPSCRRGGFLDDVGRFDAAFFGVSPNEAAMMDPQQRLMLELAWEALEDARVLPAALRGSVTGVYIGAIAGDYATLVHRRGPQAVSPYTLTGTHRSVIANRVSHFLDLGGPSLTVDSGQSSSLVAVHLACDSLRRGESELALAGGVNLNLAPESALATARFGGLSPDGTIHTFDARAGGYVRGEGGGAVVLKTLSRALADGDRVYCLVRGGAVNNDGDGEALTVPDRRGQERVLRLACERAGVDPADIQYVELHGTGTRVGDPVEAAALGAVHGAARASGRTAPLQVGSVKTNVGHLEGAAGITGLLKVVLSLVHRKLPASLHFETPHPRIPLAELGLEVRRETGDWSDSDRPLRAGVSSFGMGGTNCHLVLEEFSGQGVRPDRETGGPKRGPDEEPGASTVPARHGLWALSGRTEAALRAQARALLDHVPACSGAGPGDVGLSLAATRTAFEHRAVVLGADPDSLVRGLRRLADGQPTADVVRGTAVGSAPAPGVGPEPARCVFVFPGQGSQWLGMAAGLLGSEPVFADRMAECAEALAPFTDWSLLDAVRGVPGSPGLDRVDVVQPALWAVMVSLADLWRAYGVVPDAVIGHSQGEVAAATVAGALSLPDAARTVGLRARALRAIAGRGGMLTVALSADALRPWLEPWGDRLSVSAVNSPSGTAVSGDRDAIEGLRTRLTEAGVWARPVAIDYASHCAHVDEVLDDVRRDLAGIAPGAPAVPLVSTVTGAPLGTARLDAEYWVTNLRRPVLFEAAVRHVLADAATVFVECSPHPVLSTPLQETLESAGGRGAVLGTLRRGEGDQRSFLRATAEAYAHGLAVDWSGLYEGAVPVDLPTYAFQRQRYWFAPGHGEEPAVPPGEGGSRGREDDGIHGADRADAAGVSPSSGPTAARTGLSRPVSSEPAQDALELVRSHAAAVLGHATPDALDTSRSFKSLGFDSRTSVELRNRLNEAAGLSLPTTVVFGHPTPAGLAQHVARLLADRGDVTGPGRTEPGSTRGGAYATTGAHDPAEPLAIVAMSCRFPGGVESAEDLWRLVVEGTDAISGFPDNRGWDLGGLYDPDPGQPGRTYTRYGGFLHDADRFDPAFFGISPREAVAMDPQQRLLLETAWESVERAGIVPAALRDTSVGVFVGAMSQDYGPRLHEGADGHDGHLLTGATISVASGRIAHVMGLTGPALTVDTACSSSLAALHLAAQSLRRGECDLALAGGVCVMSGPGMFVEFSRQRGLAPDGRCKAFAEAADGTAWAEGAGMVLLERLSDARRNGHPVLALVRGSAVNQDGASNGLTAPSGPAQEQVIARALMEAGVVPADVDAVEAHGTGTTLGDPVEAGALLAVYGHDRPADRPLRLGSLKSNLGHAQAAAGVGGVIKMVMALRHELLPRTLHVDAPTSHVDWSSGRIRLLTEPEPWPRSERPRRAGVSSFGISGTNAHVVLEEAPDVLCGPPGVPEAARRSRGEASATLRTAYDASEVDRVPADGPESARASAGAPEAVEVPGSSGGLETGDVFGVADALGVADVLGPGGDSVPADRPVPDGLPGAGGRPTNAGGPGRGHGSVPWVLSGRTEGALRDQARRLVDLLAGRPGYAPADVGLSLLTTRTAFEYRAALVAGRREEFLEGLAALAEGRPDGAPVVRTVHDRPSGPVFVFPGQGAQWAGMATELLDTSTVFARRMTECAEALAPYTDWSLLDVLRGDPQAPGLDRVDVVQPVLWAMMVSLAELWRSYGVEPAAVVGHSQGEIAAACVAGALSLEDGAKAVALRSRELTALAGSGGMVSVALPADRVRAQLARRPGRVHIAVVNGPSATVVAGDREALAEFVAELGDDVTVRTVPVDYASHSPHVAPLRDRLLDVLAGVEPRPAEIPFHSSVTARELAGTVLGARYWYDNLRETVRFEDTVRGLVDQGHRVFVEISARPVLTSAIEEILDTASGTGAAVGTLRRDDGGEGRFLASLAEAYTHGVDVRWTRVFSRSGARTVELPTYAFQRQRYWLATPRSAPDVGRLGLTEADHPLLDAAVSLADGDAMVLTGLLSHAEQPWLADHVVAGAGVLSGTACVDLMLYAGGQAECESVEELILETPVAVGETVPTQLQIMLGAPDADGRRTVSLHARAQGEQLWQRCASGVVAPAAHGPGVATDAPAELMGGTWPPPGAEPVDLSGAYARLAREGYEYGPAYQGLTGLWRLGDELYAELRLPEGTPLDGFGIHPALLDAALHPVSLAGRPEPGGIALPFAWTAVRLYAEQACALRARITPVGATTWRITVTDPEGGPVAEVGALEWRPVAREQLAARVTRAEDALFRTEWQPWSGPAVSGAPRILFLDPTAPVGPGSGDRFPDLPALLASLEAGTPAPDAVVAYADERDGVQDAAVRTLELLQAWLAEERLATSRLVLVTRGAVAVRPGEQVSGIAHGSLWGLLRSAQAEQPGRFFLLDIETTDTDAAGGTGTVGENPVAAAPAPGVLAALRVDQPQLALRQGELYVPRLKPAHGAAVLPPSSGPWRLDVADAGAIDNLCAVAHPDGERRLAATEVRVAVRATGLNFRDVFVALGALPGASGVGIEVAGTVLETGAEVTGLVPGDRVAGLVRNAGSTVVTDHRLLTCVPNDWSFAQAATIPVVFLTAYHGLRALADLRPGERLMVHAAAGGVGLAALQLARHFGAEVYATASRAKWPAVRAAGVPAERIADSRTLDFERHFLTATGGDGVDVVLNSLTGEFTDASLRLLPRGGRFVEMGKVEIRRAEQVAARHPGVRYTAFDLLEVDPDRIQEMLTELMELFRRGVLTPLPVTAWPVSRARSALRHLQQARHIGKLAMVLPSTPDPEGTVLITGGTGTLGALVARHLVASYGVRHLLLAGRSGRRAEGAAELAAELEEMGARVTIAACDVTDRDALAATLAGVPERHPLTAVVHAAGVLDDAVLEAMTPEQVARVMRPKAEAARHLHELTRHLDLAAFVLFSSVAGTLGTAGQANYAAANAYLDALAEHRRAQGLPAVSLAWGLWERSSGMTGHLSEMDIARMRRSGIVPLTDRQGLALLDAALALDDAQLVPARMDRAALRDLVGRGTLSPLLGALVRVPTRRAMAAGARAAGAATGDVPLRTRLAAATDDERLALLTELVKVSVATVLAHDPLAVDPERGFRELGIDSLTGVELRNRLNTATGLRLPVSLVFDHPNVTRLARRLREVVAEAG
ncbi:type I polyketide synthase [Streptomyces acidicola]|uniref:type I polyketide synthase n=1 Tax=Streptomyces acidicola TaxID=2596892 RepID=UPI00382FF4F4